MRPRACFCIAGSTARVSFSIAGDNPDRIAANCRFAGPAYTIRYVPQPARARLKEIADAVGGKSLEEWIDSCPNAEFAALTSSP